jgi:Uncharacterised nucleotidyltransferase
MDRSTAGPTATCVRPEAELLLCCARTAVNPVGAERVAALLKGPIDWPYLIRIALRNGVASLVYRSWVIMGAQAVPASVLATFRAHSHANRLRNQLLTRELLRILGALDAEGISAVPLKGPVLAAAVYGDVGLRTITDLDILVRGPDVSRAEDVLAALGYGSTEPPIDQAAIREAKFHDAFVHRDNFTAVELHWALTPGYFSWRCDRDRLWSRLETLTLDGTPVRTLASEDLLPFLCVHGAKHCWERLEWLCGVAELVQVARERDWDRVLSEARQSGGERILLLGLMLARDLLGADLPPLFQQALREKQPRASLGGQVRRWLFDEDVRIALPERHAFFLAVMERFRHRLAYLLHHLKNANGRDRAFTPLPSVTSRLFRPLRLIATYGNPLPFLKRFAGF